MPLFTLGYEGLSLDTFLQILSDNDVEYLVDVRQRPQSRKKGFSKNALSEACADKGIAYRHFAVFGCPIDVRNAYRADGDWEIYTRSYLEHLADLPQAVEDLASFAWERRSCLLCFEADENFCHRLFVAKAVAAAGGPDAVHLNRNSIATEEFVVVMMN